MVSAVLAPVLVLVLPLVLPLSELDPQAGSAKAAATSASKTIPTPNDRRCILTVIISLFVHSAYPSPYCATQRTAVGGWATLNV